MWGQILKYAEENQLDYVVLVTDDIKEDWWWRHKGKVIGPRPELVEEIRMKTGVKAFHMCDSEQFLNSIDRYLNAPINKNLTRKLKLEKANIFLSNEEEKVAAAITAGIALEQHLRDLCDKNQIETTQTDNSGKNQPKKADRLNGELCKQKIYPLSYSKSITAWLDIRNQAAHGHEGNFTEKQVKLMIMGITDFVEKYPI